MNQQTTLGDIQKELSEFYDELGENYETTNYILALTLGGLRLQNKATKQIIFLNSSDKNLIKPSI